MSLRNKISETPAILAVLVLIPLAVGGYLLWDLLHPTGEIVPDSAFYTLDEGKTVFVGHWPPKRNDALIAVVYTCDNNKTRFVHCLYKTTEESFTPPGSTAALTRRVHYIKKPGDTEWIPESNMGKWAAIETSVKCPSGELMVVTPEGRAVKVHSEKGGAK